MKQKKPFGTNQFWKCNDQWGTTSALGHPTKCCVIQLVCHRQLSGWPSQNKFSRVQKKMRTFFIDGPWTECTDKSIAIYLQIREAAISQPFEASVRLPWANFWKQKCLSILLNNLCYLLIILPKASLFYILFVCQKIQDPRTALSTFPELLAHPLLWDKDFAYYFTLD